MKLAAMSLGRVPGAARIAGRFLSDPMSYVPGKPLERKLLVVDLPFRKLALANDPDVVETVMLDRAGEFPKSDVVHDLLAPLIGEGVFGQPGGAKVKETRRIFSRSLATIPEERISAVTRRLAAGYMDRWLAAPDGRVPMAEELARLTVDVASECTLGAVFEPRESVRFTHLFFALQKRIMPLVVMMARQDPVTRRRLLREMGIAGIAEEMRDLIRHRFVAPLLAGDGAIAAAPFPKALAEAGRLGSGLMAETAALDEIAVMLLAGHETTASTLAWLAWLLAGRSSVQEVAAAAVRGEPQAASGGLAEASAQEVLDALANETLRLYPPIGFFLRETTADVEFRQRPIPKGSFMLVSPWTLHRHRKLWPEPEAFSPERWLGLAEPPPRTSYMPFGLGARICPGARFATLEMAEIVRTLLTCARLSPAGGRLPKPLGNLTSRPDREVWLRLEARTPPQCA